MEISTRGDAESLDNFELDESTINELVSISYNSIMTEIKEEWPTSTSPKTKKSTTSRCRKDRPKSTTRHSDSVNPNYLYQEDEYLPVSGDMDNVSSDMLFMVDCVGNKKLKCKFEEKDEPESESKVEIYSDDHDGKTSKTSMVALPTRSRDEDEESEDTTHVKEVNKKKNLKYCFNSSIESHLDKILPKAKAGVTRLLETTKPAADPTSEIKTQRQKKKMNKERREKVCSDKWFNMKAPELTKDVKNQLTILRLREILDQKNFYKSNDRKKFPKFFQMGKVVESPADFYHARIPKKQRKSTLLAEVMADADLKKYQKRKYAEIFGDAKKRKNKQKRKPVST